jgi:hypothetical protein
MSTSDYKAHALAALPQWLAKGDRPFEEMEAFAEIFQRVDDQAVYWVDLSYINNADAGPPDWLNQHAKDRGTYRQLGESNAALRERLRNFSDAITPELIRDTLAGLMTANSIVGTVGVLELSRDRAFFGSYTRQTGTGGTFTAPVANVQQFTPNVVYSGAPYDASQPINPYEIVFSGAANAVNNGTRLITGLNGNAVKFTNATGVALVDGGVAWILSKRDPVFTTIVIDQFSKSYLSRGYRMGSDIPTLLLIFPYPTTTAQAAGMIEAIRLKKGAGVRILYDIRSIP